MKMLLSKGAILASVIGLGIIVYYVSNDHNENSTYNETTANKEQFSSKSNILQSNNSKVSSFISKDNLDQKLNTNINELNKMLAKTKEMLKNHNKNNPNKIITDKEVDRLLSLDIEEDTLQSNTKLDFESQSQKSELDNKSTSTNSTLSYSSSNSSSSALSNSETSSTTSNDSVTTTQTSNTDTKVNTQIVQLKTEIDSVKQVIKQLSANNL